MPQQEAPEAGYSLVELVRPAVTPDIRDRSLSNVGTTELIFAHGADAAPAYHGVESRGLGKLDFSKVHTRAAPCGHSR